MNNLQYTQQVSVSDLIITSIRVRESNYVTSLTCFDRYVDTKILHSEIASHLCDSSCKPDIKASTELIPSTEMAIAKEIAFLLQGRLRHNPKIENGKSGAWELKDERDEWTVIDGESFLTRLINDYAGFWLQAYEVHMDLYKTALLEVAQEYGIRDFESESIRGEEFKSVPDTAFDKEKKKLYDHQKSLLNSSHKITALTATSHNLQTNRGVNAVKELMKGYLPVNIPTNSQIQLLGSNFGSLRKFPTPLVDGIFPRIGIGQIYGESYAGKSFSAVSLAMAVATGQPSWAGRDLNVANSGSKVLYIAAEGGEPFWKMVNGWMQGHGLDPEQPLENLLVLDADSMNGDQESLPFQLTKSGKPEDGVFSTSQLRKQLEDIDFKPELVIIDPQANVTRGIDENSMELIDALLPVKRWATEDECLILLVHHSGKDGSKGARGSSGQMAMMDVQASFEKSDTGGGRRVMKFHKLKGMKNFEGGLEFEFHEVDPSNDIAYLKFVGKTVSEKEKNKIAESSEKLHILQTLNVYEDASTEAMSAAKIAEKLGKSDHFRKKVLPSLLRELEVEGLIENRSGNVKNPQWFRVIKGGDI